MKNGKLTDKIKQLPVLSLVLNGTLTGTGTVFSILFFLILAVIMLFSHTKIELGEDTLKASAVLVAPVEVRYEEIQEITLMDFDDFDLGVRSRGINNLFTLSGSYSNAEIGIYDLYLYKSNKDNLIVIRYQDMLYLVINKKTAGETEKLMEQLEGLIAQAVDTPAA